jgi:hypothetical protein
MWYESDQVRESLNMPKASVPANGKSVLTRRGLLIGSASVAASTALSGHAATPAEPDAELLALSARFAAALASYYAAERHRNTCENLLLEGLPSVPAVLHDTRGRLGRLLPDRHSWSSATELRGVLRRRSCRELWEEARAALPIAKAYEAQVRRVERASGFPAAEAAHEAAMHALGDLMRRIGAVPARSPAGLAVKTRAVKQWGRPEWWSPNEAHADSTDRLMAEVLDAVIACEAGSLPPLG